MRKKQFSYNRPLNGHGLERLQCPPFDYASQQPLVQTDRLVMRFAVALISMSAFQAPSALAQSQPIQVIIQDAPYTPSAPVPAATRDPSEIQGIRIESNGALITGPVNARRVYIPLNRPFIPEGMRGHWARSADICDLPSDREKADGQAVATDNALITKQEIVAKRRFQVLQTFIPLPPTFTLAMLESGRPLMAPAHKHKRAEEILVIFSMPDGHRDFSVISLHSEGQAITLRRRSSHETAVRCAMGRDVG